VNLKGNHPACEQHPPAVQTVPRNRLFVREATGKPAVMQPT